MPSIKFTDIPNRLRYLPTYKGILSSYHSDIIEYVCNHFQDNRKYRMSVILLMNKVSYVVYSNDALPNNWNPLENPFEPKTYWDNIYVDNQTARIKDIYIDYSDVEWNIEPVGELDVQSKKSIESSIEAQNLSAQQSVVKRREVTKDDLSIQPPVYARFDTNKVWKSQVIDGTNYTIYTSLPEIPTIQREISVTTDISKMNDADLMNLFPQTRILTRYSSLYNYVDDIEYHNILGCITPICDFTEEQIIDNIVKYPHFYQLKKVVDGEVVNFYNTIEISGKLYKTLDIWDTLPESKIIPRQYEFIKDYVVRRYLLERDVYGMEHKYPMYGTLEPFLTLFTTPEDYASLGYTDSLDLAKQCVQSRVSYNQSRNPVIRRFEENV